MILNGQCIGIKVIQSCVISQPVKSLLDVVLQEVVGFKINIGGRIL